MPEISRSGSRCLYQSCIKHARGHGSSPDSVISGGNQWTRGDGRDNGRNENEGERERERERERRGGQGEGDEDAVREGASLAGHT